MMYFEKWKYWLRRILGNQKKQCRSFCVSCEYYVNCKSDS